MSRSLTARIRDPRVIGALTVVGAIAMVAGFRGSANAPDAAAVLDVTPSLATVAPFNDTALEQWHLVLPPDPTSKAAVRAPAAAPAPDVNWYALAAGVADVSIGDAPGRIVVADMHAGLSDDQCRAIIAAAEAEEFERNRGTQPRGIGAVIARGTPSGGGSCD